MQIIVDYRINLSRLWILDYRMENCRWWAVDSIAQATDGFASLSKEQRTVGHNLNMEDGYWNIANCNFPIANSQILIAKNRQTI